MERDFGAEIKELTKTIDNQEKQSVGGKTLLERENAKTAGQNVTEYLQDVLNDFNKLPKAQRQQILGELPEKAMKHLRMDPKGQDDFIVSSLHIPPLFDASGKRIEQK